MDGYGDLVERVSNQVVDSIYENRDREKFYYLHLLEGAGWDRMGKNGQSLLVRIDGKLGLLIDVFRPQWTLRRSGPIVMSRRFLG